MAEGRRSKDIDQAALILTLLVAGWQVIGQSGPWLPINSLLGLVLLLIISAYSYPTLDRRFMRIYLQVAAVAVGASVSLCLILAWPAQEIIYVITVKLWRWSASGDDLGIYTTNVAFPIILLFALPWSYRRIEHWAKANTAKADVLKNDDPTANAALPIILLFPVPWRYRPVGRQLKTNTTKTDISDNKAKNAPSVADAPNGPGHAVPASQAAHTHTGSSAISHSQTNANENLPLTSDDSKHSASNDKKMAGESMPAPEDQEEDSPSQRTETL